ncbi:MAG: RND transporter [Gracilibacter sp. BRH_c7a]|nr:MAG: RND transporter [Gracilibacter sp. BRH_c7a]
MNTKRKSKYKKWIISSVIILVLAGASATYLMRTSPLPYESVQAQIGDISNNYKFQGNVETKNRQTVLSERVMQVSKINYQEGDIVKEGDVLINSTTRDEIKAKINGEIVNLNLEEGSQVMAGTVLMEIVDYQNLEISIKVDEYDLPAVKKDQKAIVNIAAVQKVLEGTISGISKEGTVMSGVTFFPATIDLSPDSSLKIGMTAEVTLTKEQVAGVVTLPMTAIQFDNNNNPYVLKKGENSTIINTEITTGINDGIIVEITNGVAEGETIYYPKIIAANDFDFGSRRAD